MSGQQYGAMKVPTWHPHAGTVARRLVLMFALKCLFERVHTEILMHIWMVCKGKECLSPSELEKRSNNLVSLRNVLWVKRFDISSLGKF